MYPLIYRHLVFPAYHTLKRDGINRALRNARKYANAPMPALARLQRSKLVRLLKHAQQHVPYYRQQLTDARSDEALLSAFSELPALTKSITREQGENLLTPKMHRHTPLIANSTGGSTGETLKFYNDGWSRACGTATTLCEYQALGIGMGERFAQLWGAPMDIGRSASLRGRVHALVTRRLFMSTYHLSVDDMERYYQAITRFRPVLMISYPSPMAHFCEYLDATGRRLDTLQAAVVSAETLFPWQRELIERVAGCQVYNRYGSREFGNMAIEHPGQTGMRVEMDRVVLELLDENMQPVREGESGHIHVTDLDNTGMPFIRYSIGDMACGMAEEGWPDSPGWSRFAAVEGRSFDVVKAPNGNSLGGTFWTLLLRARPGMRQFQVRQITGDRLMIDYIPEDGMENLPEPSLRHWRSEITKHCGDGMQVEFRAVSNIATTRSGKLLIVMSDLSGNHP